MIKLWTHIKGCEENFQEYLKLSWNEIKTAEMEDDIKKQRKVLIDMRNIDKRCNTFIGITLDLKNWVNGKA